MMNGAVHPGTLFTISDIVTTYSYSICGYLSSSQCPSQWTVLTLEPLQYESFQVVEHNIR